MIKLRGGVLDGLLVGQDHEDAGAAHRPKAFFQVAIDVPGFGDSKGSPQPDFVPTKLLKELIRALGKEYAYAIITCSHAAANVLNALLQVRHRLVIPLASYEPNSHIQSYPASR